VADGRDVPADRGTTRPVRREATAASDIVEARFVEVVPGVRVVQAVDFVSDDPANAGPMAMTWQLTAVDAATRGAFLPSTSPLE
jgi:hypothetical protein